VAGLVAITPAGPGYVSPVGSILLGLPRRHDLLRLHHAQVQDRAWTTRSTSAAVHLVGGILGALLIGFLGDSKIAGADGLFYGGGWTLMGKQALAVGFVRSPTPSSQR